MLQQNGDDAHRAAKLAVALDQKTKAADAFQAAKIKLEALQICQNLRKNSDFSEIILIALLPDDGNTMSFDRSSINETFKKPFDARLLAERLRTLIGAKKELV